MNFHQTSAHATFLAAIGWQIKPVGIGGNRINAFIRTLPLLPISLLKLQRVNPLQLDWDKISSLEKKYHVYETVLEIDRISEQEPTIDLFLLSRGFLLARDYMLTTKTRVIDLRQTDNQLLAAMKSKARYNIRRAKRNHLKTRIWTAGDLVRRNELFERYYALLKLNSQRIHMLLLPKDWIKKQLTAFDKEGFVVEVTEKDAENLIAVATFFTSDNTCCYSHNGSTELGRKLMAPTLAIWTGMKEGKKRNLPIFDFDGVYDERYPQQKRFQGFATFKAGFGGTEVYFPPMYRRRRCPF